MNHDNKIVLVFLVRNDIRLSKGKIAGYVGHATQYIVEDCIQRKYVSYVTWKKFHNSKKIVLKVNSEKEFNDLHSKLLDLSHKLHFPVKVVKFEIETSMMHEGMPIVVGFGPIKRNEVDGIIGNLKLL
jgi:peptidyl-tRNA hydrolase